MSVELFKVQKYSKTRKVLKNFESDSENLGHGKLKKVMEKVMEFEEPKRVQTLLFNYHVYLINLS